MTGYNSVLNQQCNASKDRELGGPRRNMYIPMVKVKIVARVSVGLGFAVWSLQGVAGLVLRNIDPELLLTPLRSSKHAVLSCSSTNGTNCRKFPACTPDVRGLPYYREVILEPPAGKGDI